MPTADAELSSGTVTVEGYGSQVVKTTGDDVHAEFARAEDGLAAALDDHGHSC